MIRAYFKDVIFCLLMNYCKVGTLRLKKTFEGVKVRVANILRFRSRWRGMVGFIPRPLNPWGQHALCKSNRRLGGPHGRLVILEKRQKSSNNSPDALRYQRLTLILRCSRTGTVWFYTSTSNKRAARPKLYTESLTRDLKLMYSRLTLVRISIKL